ncbi:uncharacterized protein RAG0_15845 [Rhynchosporium agropyri]|uniref:Uncharacterized protein n=1 Tax=Rhynchosporium agropyri TaxID=914238 RepID=A0A1E1LMS0_9HELO|nr:uncharacterized protein RAG0_15845 [Rhynchosporium agropyri]
MKIHFALWSLLGLFVGSLSIPVGTTATSNVQDAEDVPVEVKLRLPSVSNPISFSPKDGAPTTDLAPRDVQTDVAIYEHGLNKRADPNIQYHRRWVKLILKRAINGIPAQTFKFVIDLAYKDDQTMWQKFVRRLSTTGTWVGREVSEIDHYWKKPHGYDILLQYTFNVIIDAKESLRLRLQWQDWLTADPQLAGAQHPSHSWCALVQPGVEYGLSALTDFGFSFTDQKPESW